MKKRDCENNDSFRHSPANVISKMSNRSAGNSATMAIVGPKISVVMPSYNQQEFIERSILSVLNQNYPNLEFIIIDGGSKDGTVDIIKKYESIIAYWISEPDNGQSDALNKGFARATGDICGWLNSDDIYMPGAFERVVAAFSRHPEKDIVFGDWLAINIEGRILAHEYAFDFNLSQLKYEGAAINAQAMFWRCEVHERFGGFLVSLHNTMDYQMILAFGINEGNSAFLRVPEALGCFRRYDAQKTGNFNERVLNEHRLIAELYGYTDKFEWRGKVKRCIYRIRRALWYLKRGGISYFVLKFVSSQELIHPFTKKKYQ